MEECILFYFVIKFVSSPNLVLSWNHMRCYHLK